jgi:hypothetical protein
LPEELKAAEKSVEKSGKNRIGCLELVKLEEDL